MTFENIFIFIGLAILTRFVIKFFWALFCSYKIYFKGRTYALKKFNFIRWMTTNLLDPIFFMAKLIFEDSENAAKLTSDPHRFLAYHFKEVSKELNKISKENQNVPTQHELNVALTGENTFHDLFLFGMKNKNFDGAFDYEFYKKLDQEEKSFDYTKKEIEKIRMEIIKQSNKELKNAKKEERRSQRSAKN